MRRSVEMSEVSLLVPQEKLDSTINLLYDLKLMEFFDSRFQSLDDIEKNEINAESEELVSIRSIISYLKPFFTHMEGSYSDDIITSVYSYIDRKHELEQLQIQVKDSKLRERVKKQLYLTPRKIEQGIIGYVDSSKASVVEEHKKNTKGVRMYTHESRTYFYSPTDVPFKYKEYFIPIKQSERTSQKEIEKELEYIHKQLKILANANLRHLQAKELKLSKELEVERSKEYFKESKYHVVLQGFVPNKEVSQLDIALKRELADSYEIEVTSAKSSEAPVLLPNSGLSKSFETLLSFYSFPKYREVDPSVIMMLFFPLFFGFILGDFGYGVLSFLFFAFLKYKLPDMKSLLNVMQLSAVSSMIFGVIYGEYFGFEPKLFAFEFHRANSPETLLIIALIFGLFHINLGFVVGIINSIKHSVKKVFTDYVSWMILQLGALFIYISTITPYSELSFIGYGCIVITILLLYMGHGFQGVIEIPTLFTNIMSYARLMAVGISSIAIAVLINEYSVPLIQSGFIGAIFGVILFTFGHIFNIVLGNFESFLQSLRLHYVEFFSKFYEGGGREFKPFGVKTREE